MPLKTTPLDPEDLTDLSGIAEAIRERSSPSPPPDTPAINARVIQALSQAINLLTEENARLLNENMVLRMDKDLAEDSFRHMAALTSRLAGVTEEVLPQISKDEVEAARRSAQRTMEEWEKTNGI